MLLYNASQIQNIIKRRPSLLLAALKLSKALPILVLII